MLVSSPWIPRHPQRLVWILHDIAHGDTCYATMTSVVRVAPDLESRSELKCQPALPQTNFVTLGKQAVS